MQVPVSVRKLDFSFLCCKIFYFSNQQQRIMLSKTLNIHPNWKHHLQTRYNLEQVLSTLNIEQICQNQILFIDNLWIAEKAKTAK